MNKIKTTFQLETKGIHFLSGDSLKLVFGPDGTTYQQGYQAIKEFYCSTLLPEGASCKGKVQARKEILTPLGENLIVEKWLDKIDVRLKEHILQTRSAIFTPDRPTLVDNQRILCDQIDTMIAEIEANSADIEGIQPLGIQLSVREGD